MDESNDGCHWPLTQVEGLRLGPALALGRRATEIDEPSLVRVQVQSEPLQALGQHVEDSSRVVLELEHDHESSSPGESHPQALTEPDVKLSLHRPITEHHGAQSAVSTHLDADRHAR